jgi:hypothetical protein
VNLVGPTSIGQERLLKKIAETYPGKLHDKPLDGRHIRLLDIQNAKFEGNVLHGLRLVTVPLADAPSFDALSYCSGDMRLCTGIFSTPEHAKT